MTEAEQRRHNMVESQVRPADVTDRRIIRAMRALPRELFAPSDRAALAYMDKDLPVAEGRVLLAPRVQAKLIQLAEIEPGDRVLDVGAATGYSTALIAHLAAHVVGVEPSADLVAHAQRTLAGLGISNVTLLDGPLTHGAPSAGIFDAIVINGAVHELPEALVDQLKTDGRLVAILKDGGPGKAMLYRKTGAGLSGRPVFDADAARLPGFERAPHFVF